MAVTDLFKLTHCFIKSGKATLDYAKSANIDDDVKKAMKCCEVDKEKQLQFLQKL
jgi:hypothetical protein